MDSEKFWNYSLSTGLSFLPGYLVEMKDILKICKNRTSGKRLMFLHVF